MRFLLDTNILLRMSEAAHPHHAAAIGSVRRLAATGHLFCISSQTIAEFLAVATRPVTDRGLGMNQKDADAEVTKLTTALEILYDSSTVIDELRRLVVAHSVVGKSVHDTRLVASMMANGIRDILTFNGRDFTRFTAINIHDPSAIASSPAPTTP